MNYKVSPMRSNLRHLTDALASKAIGAYEGAGVLPASIARNELEGQRMDVEASRRSGAEKNLAYSDFFYREEGQGHFVWSAGRTDHGRGASSQPTTRTLHQ